MWNTWWRFQLHEFVKLITEVRVTREEPQLFPLGMHHSHTHAVWLYAPDALWREGWDVLRNHQESATSASCNVEKVNTNSVVQRWNGEEKKKREVKKLCASQVQNHTACIISNQAFSCGQSGPSHMPPAPTHTMRTITSYQTQQQLHAQQSALYTSVFVPLGSIWK